MSYLASRVLTKQLQRKRKRPKLRALYPPQGIEYQRAMVTYTRLIERVVREYLLDPLPHILGQSTAPTGSQQTRTDDLGSDLERALRRIRGILEAAGAPVQQLVARLLGQQQAQHARNFVEAYGTSIPGINPLIGAEEWLRERFQIELAENARLIKSIPEQLLGQVEGIINRGVLDGTSTVEIGKQIAERFGVTERRGRNIARDQVSKWHSSLNRLRMVDAGVEEYEWSTSLDDRVRPTHRARHGNVYRLDTPPPGTGHPGHEPNCRCTEIPVISEYEAEERPQSAGLGYAEARAARDKRLAAG
jgi:SPP1 gp7 family putative phage head morphogenesis protein